MTQKKSYLTCDGSLLKALAEAGLKWLEGHYQRVNELNVFPVPDGDTGTNMLLTMRNAVKEVADVETTNAAKIASKVAYGAMMGSRGNSGTILSQLWIGFAETLDNADAFNARLLTKGLRAATDKAYRGVQHPVEGTILTVAREMTEEAESLVESTPDLQELLSYMVTRGWDAVQRTPDMLPTLKQAGVVDSGGTGLMYILEGMLRHLRNEPVTVDGETVHFDVTALEDDHAVGHIEHPGENIYDVQFVIKGEHLNGDIIKSAMESMGDSVVVVQNPTAVKVHVHVSNPGHPLEYAANVGQITDIVVENMLEQYEEFARQKQIPKEALNLQPIEPGQIAVIAITPGPGLASVFKQLGVAGLVNGGQTNNPSVEEFLKTINSLKTDQIILLPNNKNIILTANQVAELSKDKTIKVIPTRTVPQGISAMLPYQMNGNIEEVAEAMTDSKDHVITGEVTFATRSVELDGVKVEESQAIGLLDGKLKVAGDTLEHVVQKLLSIADLEDKELVTLYYGEEVSESEAQALVETLAESYPDLEFEMIFGGQPHYPYILGVE